MKKINVRLLTLLSVSCLLVACNDDSMSDEELVVDKEISTSGKVINLKGAHNGVVYSFKDVSLNSELLVLNKQNIELLSTANELENGIIKFKAISDEILDKITENRILFISSHDNTFLRKIVSINKDINGNFELVTALAHLGEAFEGGEINFKVDLFNGSQSNEQNAIYSQNSNYEQNYFYDIVNLNSNHNLWNFNYNPATNISMSLNVGMSFSQQQLLPTQFSTVFELNTNVNPYFTFAGSYNQTHSDDFVKFIPQSVIDLIKTQEFEIDIPVNTFGIESLPAKVKIKDINMPISLEANISKQSDLTYGFNGKLKIGYIANIKGFNVTKTPVFENNLQVNLPSTSSFGGELITSTGIVITPSISILNGSYNVSGDLKMTVDSETSGYLSYPQNQPVFGSKGVFKASSNLILDLFLAKVPIEILNQQKDLWTVGTIDKSIIYSNLSWNVLSNYTTNILNSTRVYKTNFSLDYRYPIMGKMLPNQLFISYDVYQKNGTTKIISVSNASLTPQNLTTSNFTFSLDIPYKKTGGLFSTTYENQSVIKNIVIRDNKGYIYEGVLNPTTNVVENSFTITR